MKLSSAFTLLLSALVLGTSAVSLSHSEIVEKSARGLRLLRLSDGAEPVWNTESEKLELMRARIRFFDVTEVYELQQKLGGVRTKEDVQIAATYPAPSHQAQVNPIISTLSLANMQSTLTSLTAFNNRYYTSSTGVSASNYILTTVNSIISGRTDITASQFTHSWAQPSVIVKIAGTSAQTPITIIGAHMDSINLSSPSSGRAPGADDDGTGVIILIETLRALVAAGFKPRTPVEFHFYAAEEVGLLGSQAIATNYRNAGKAVKAMMQLDMAGYSRPGSTPVFALTADYIDTGLNAWLKTLVPLYSSLPAVDDEPCGYACSDHASWYQSGYPASAPYEAVTGDDNPYIHSSGDTTSVSGFSWTHVMEFAKVSVGYVYEMAI